ncbi:hypothetical protein BDN72DRAFT_372353 [Pluteus cervinus]|uniref:Uncharacterized protein n=1 Tax=Pluteus cervinus TaxID=181527 RepID=A0ACD3B332_9AGAR|nr:hypothetical protein BDN72DRAFT_372353 [Pluteus cervinus]
MVLMEVDRQLRARVKRARSPDGDSPPRATKRLSLASREILSLGLPVAHLPTGVATTTSSRHPSEDWVAQTGGLSIDSPVFPGYSLLTPTLEGDNRGLNVIEDEDMNMDAESDFLQPHGRGLLQSTSSLSQNVVAGASDPTSSNGGQQTQPQLIHPTPHLSTMDSTDLLQHFGGLRHPETRPSSPNEMAISPTPSMYISGRWKKPKFSMGPRADCEKCRLGVKGHWVHLD